MDTLPPEAVEAPTPPSRAPLTARLLNIYATPGEVFESLQAAPPTAVNWLVPLLLACLASVLYAQVAFSQPNVQQRIKEKHEQQLQSLVDAGKLSTAEAEASEQRMESIGMTAAKVVSAFGAVVGNFVLIFTVAGVLVLLGTLLGSKRCAYPRALEVSGLSGMILVLGTVVQMLLVLLVGNMAVTPGPSLFLNEIDLNNRLHLILASINFITFWYLGVLSIGLSKIGGLSLAKACLPLAGLWIVLRVGTVLAGWGNLES